MERLRSINPEQLASLLRTVLQVLGGVVIANGWASDGQWSEWSGAALIIIPTIWGLISRKDSNLIKSAAGVPAVEKIVAPGTAVAGDADDPKAKPS